MPIITNLKRLGRFQVHINFIDKGNPDQLKQLFGKVIITRAEMLLHAGCIDYMAISDEFELVKPGAQIPLYKFEFDGKDWKAKQIEETFNKLDKE